MAANLPEVPLIIKMFPKKVLWDFVGFGVEALAGSRECVPAEASTPPEFLKAPKKQLQVVIDVEDVILRRGLDSQIV